MVAAVYLDPKFGSDSRDGTTLEGAFLTPAAAVAAVDVGGVITVNPTADIRAALLPTKALTVKVLGWTAGTTRRARFLGSTQKTGWAYDSANRWGVAHATDPKTLAFVTAAGLWLKGVRRASKAAVVQALDWYYDSGAGVIWSFSPPDDGGAAVSPTTNYAAVEIGSLTQGVYASGVHNVTLLGLTFRGVLGAGSNVTSCKNWLQEDCEFSFCSEDGFGGGGSTSGYVVRRCLSEANGFIRPATLGEVASEGDGGSPHDTMSYLVEDVVFRDNLKSAWAPVQGATGTLRRCISYRSNLNFTVGTSSGETVYEHCRVVMGADDIGGFGIAGLGAGAAARILACGVYGAGTSYGAPSNNVGITVFSAGPVTIKGTWVRNTRQGLLYVAAGSWDEKGNSVTGNGTDATGVTLHASDPTGDPLFVDPANDDFRTAEGSPLRDAGIDLSGLATALDLAGRARPVGAWDIGPYEAEPETVKGRILAHALATLRAVTAGDDYWNSLDLAGQVIDGGVPGDRINTFPGIVQAEADDRESSDVAINGYDERTLTLQFICAIRDGNKATVKRSIARLVSDIRKALQADHTRGGLAVDTRVARDATAIDESQSPIYFFVVEAEIDYRHGTKNPASLEPSF